MALPRERTILHIDMDAFFVSVERLDNPALRGLPVVVGGDGARGVVASASYEARAFGVYSAMSSVQARKLCPQAVFIQGNYGRYSAISTQVMEILTSFTPLVEPLSLDEAFCDVTGALHGIRTGRDVANEMRDAVRREIGLACGVGVAATKFVAKVASKHAKPPIPRRHEPPQEGLGVVVVPESATRAFLGPLSVRELWGVGPVTERHLTNLGVQTIGQLAELPVATLRHRLGHAAGSRLHNLALGIDDRSVVPDIEPKSVGNEETFVHDLTTQAELRVALARLVDATATRMVHKAVRGRTITLKVKYADFSQVTRSHTLPEATDRSRRIGAVARQLLAGLDVTAGVRLLGVSVSGFNDLHEHHQLSFDEFEPVDDQWVEAEATVDAIRERFGHNAIAPAVLMDQNKVHVRRRGDRQWGPPRRAPMPDADRPR